MERIGRYEIRRLLGDGATSSVYLAHDPFSQTEVAIKQLHPALVADGTRGRLYRRLFVSEAALAGRLPHPHIVPVHDAIIDDTNAYVVMEYVPGGTLAAFCQPDRLLTFDRLVEIIFKCTRALDYAYRHGITHRHIKPANILLTDPDGRDIKLSDFGSALHTASDTTQIAGLGSHALQRGIDTCRMHFYKGFLEVLATRLSLANACIANQ